MSDGKLRAQRTWGDRPTGSTHAQGYQPGTLEFFETARSKRNSEELPWLDELIPFAGMRDRKVLEIGCGPGFDALTFLDAGADYTGIDITPENVDRARKHLAFYGFAADVRQGDAEQLEFEDGTFDVAFSNGVLHHTPDIGKAVSEAARVLKSGGIFYLIVYHRNSVFYRLSNSLSGLLRGRLPSQQIRHIEFNTKGETPIVNVYSRGEVGKLLEAGGLRVDDVSVRRLTPLEFPFSSVLGGFYRAVLPRPLLKRLERIAGWYVVARATKP